MPPPKLDMPEETEVGAMKTPREAYSANASIDSALTIQIYILTPRDSSVCRADALHASLGAPVALWGGEDHGY